MLDAGSARLCVVVPCYNEEESLGPFFSDVIPALDEATDGEWSILCVDDGSSDATRAVIARWHRRDSRISGISLSRNFGHQAAVSAGLAYARAEYVGIMDCDLQDPAEVLVELYRACLRDNLDVCHGIRGRRDAPLFLRVAYSAFYRLIQCTADHNWPRDAGDFCVMSARCQQALLALPEQSRMLRGLRSWIGFRQSGIVYKRPARHRGVSKYNLARLTALALQGLISFSSIPLRLASLMGIAMGVFSVAVGILVLINRLFPRFTLLGYWVGANPGTATLLVFLSLTLSVLFVCLGVIGEYLVVVMQEIKRRPAAVVASVIGDLRPRDAAYSLLDATERPSQWTVTAR
ncbi:MAG TPA: glycosyltransferase family 2 protein [Bryobacteraceae bacterium]|nr:glycosyltransferase family 2 protein [Bryobacteraceae bacterium]